MVQPGNPTSSTIGQLRNGVLFLILLMGLGCRSGADYQGSSLPEYLRSSPEPNAAAIDLTSIASHSINEDLIYPGDVLEVQVSTGIEETEPTTWTLRVTDRGTIDVPLVGTAQVAGFTLADAEQAIRQLSVEREIYRHPHVSVLMKQRRMIRVRVVGAVKEPGVYELPAAGSDLLAAIVAAGGLNEDAGTLVELRHPNGLRQLSNDTRYEGVMLASFEQAPEIPQRVTKVDLTEPSQAGVDLHVEDGSIVMVNERPNHSLSVIGLVKRPGNYELPKDETSRVLDAVALAGGRTVSIADKVRVIRNIPGETNPIVIEVSVKKAKINGKENLVLAAGDTVSVEETPSTFIVETVRSFVRFGFSSAVPGF
ncbi:MAG: hypothetical protein GY768_04340 [Planctomycetaceae bacterium]|nr:hypothetical protein [Planctomycetaceae bacterium]